MKRKVLFTLMLAIVSGVWMTNKADDMRLNSLCDEWNVLHEPFSMPVETYTIRYYLSQDTIINGQRYAQLATDTYRPYKGAMREGNNRDIYYIPPRSTQEYLLYAFNVQVGDQLTNLYLGEYGEESGYHGVVESISDDSPRVFTIRVSLPDPEAGMDSVDSFPVRWIEGVGSPETPYGMAAVPSMSVAADVGVYTLLCAYKNGAHIFTSDLGEQYGCVYNYDPYSTHVDTIPLYAGDDPGSSTVDPVDPNQVVVTLKGDELSIHENMGVDITYTLQHNSPAQAPSQSRAPQSDTYRDEVTIQITASGEYLLQLTNPSWDYTIFGRFYYSPQGIWNVVLTEQAQKVVVDGVIYIVRDNKMYNLQGAQVR